MRCASASCQPKPSRDLAGADERIEQWRTHSRLIGAPHTAAACGAIARWPDATQVHKSHGLKRRSSRTGRVSVIGNEVPRCEVRNLINSFERGKSMVIVTLGSDSAKTCSPCTASMRLIEAR
jgi:hypothetical protein